MLVELLSQSNYQSFNIKLAQLLGLESAIYLSALIDINEKAFRKNKIIDHGFFMVDRDYIKARTTLTKSKQEKIECELNKLGILELSNDHLKINLEILTSLVLEENEEIRRDLSDFRKAANSKNKGDYILENERYVHNQQEGITTHVISRTCIFTTLKNVKSRDGVMKILQHKFFGTHSAYHDEQEEYGEMISNVLDGVAKYIKGGDTELVDVFEKYYAERYKDYHYHFDRDKSSQELIRKMRTCYLEAGLRERGRRMFYEKTSEIFKPHEGEETKWDSIRQVFSLLLSFPFHYFIS